jgi:hypothetical protein
MAFRIAAGSLVTADDAGAEASDQGATAHDQHDASRCVQHAEVAPRTEVEQFAPSGR